MVLSTVPHILDYKVVKEGSYNEDGDFVEGTSSWVENYCRCDMVPSGRANTIITTDGQEETYSYTIYNLPVGCREFRYGDIVRVKRYGDSGDTHEFVVKGFHRYQLQCKIWV